MGKITAIGAIGDVILGSSLTFETNITILNFTSEFDLAQVECAQTESSLVKRKFNLGFPGMCYYYYYHIIIFI